MLELAGVAHALTEEQKIIKFEAGLREEKAIVTVSILKVPGIHSLKMIKHSTLITTPSPLS